jgi:hypothetical protein
MQALDYKTKENSYMYCTVAQPLVNTFSVVKIMQRSVTVDPLSWTSE